MSATPSWTGFAVALGIGLLIGIERERRKGHGSGREVAGIRTFAVVTLLGAAAMAFDAWVLAAALLALGALVAVAHVRRSGTDPGITTESSLLLCLLLGALAMHVPMLAAGLAAVLAALLAARDSLHRFARGVLTADELHDLLVLATATLVILPLLPERPFGPFGAIHLRTSWILVILIMAIGGLAHALLRLLGSRAGLPLAGFLSGFVSSAATVGVMGAHAKAHPQERRPAVAAAVLSTLATFVQLAAVLAVADRATLRALAVPLACGAGTAALYGVLVTMHELRRGQPQEPANGRLFGLGTALLLGGMLALVQLLAAAMRMWLGAGGLAVAMALAGLADAHAAAISVASMVATGTLAPMAAGAPILLAFSTNTLTKAVLAVIAGDARYARPVLIGLALVLAATWLGWWLANAIAPG